MAKTETKPQTTKPQGLDRTKRHLGTFTNFRKQDFQAYLIWTDDEETRRGFELRDAKSHRQFKPGLLIMKLEELAQAKVQFVLSGETEPIDEKLAAVHEEIQEAEHAEEQRQAEAKEKLKATRARLKNRDDQ